MLGPINIEIKRGEIVFLIGDNGSGKTTFIYVVAGLLDLKEGCIEVDGVPLKPEDMAAYRSRISAIFSQFHVFRQLYGLENVDAAVAAAIFEKVGLKGITDIADGAITRLDLSAGQKRRLALAIALLENRDFLSWMNSWLTRTRGNAPISSRPCCQLKSQGKTILVSTHDMQWIQFCDRLYKFDNGKFAEVPVTGGVQGQAS